MHAIIESSVNRAPRLNDRAGIKGSKEINRIGIYFRTAGVLTFLNETLKAGVLVFKETINTYLVINSSDRFRFYIHEMKS